MADTPIGTDGQDHPEYRRIVETAQLGIWVLTPEGTTAFANAKMSEILGYSPEELAALSLFDVLDEAGKAQAAKNLQRRRQGIADQLECSFIRKDASQVCSTPAPFPTTPAPTSGRCA